MISKIPDSAAPDLAGSGAPDQSRRRGLRLRSLMLGAALGLVVAIVAVVAYLIFTREHNPRLTQADYDAAARRWETHGPASYDLDLELTGNRNATIHVEVRDGEIVHMIRDGVEPRQQRTWYYWSVPGQLDTIGQELEMARDPAASFHNPSASQMVMWAEFDPTLGYPRRYDRVVLGADFEVHWRVTRFQALPAKN